MEVKIKRYKSGKNSGVKRIEEMVDVNTQYHERVRNGCVLF